MQLSRISLAPTEDVIHGVVVHDPYRWLEDRSLAETQEWILEQQKHCDDYFARCGSLTAIRNHVREYLDTEVVDQPAKVGGRYFYRRRARGKEQASIYVRKIATGTERLLVDPSSRGPFASVGIHYISEDGALLAYEAKQGGEDRKAIYFVDVESGEELHDKIAPGHARGLVFTQDGRGSFYCHEVLTDIHEHRILFHLFHESVADQVIFRRARSRESRLVLTADGVHLGATWVHRDLTTSVADFWIARRDAPTHWQQVFSNRRLPINSILGYGRIFVLSSEDAPNGELIELNTAGHKINTIVPEQEGMIRQVVIAGVTVYISYLHNQIPSIQRWDLSGKAQGTIDIPLDGTIGLLPHQSCSDDSVFYTYESFAHPPEIFEYLPAAERSQLWHRRISPDSAAPCSIRRNSYPSKDGTQIPVTLIARQGVTPKTETPLIMTGYGGFGVPMTPQFSVLVSVMMELGATFVLSQIRGGGDFGKAWHEAARRRNRQASFDDFIAVAEGLCADGETTRQKLAIFGGSNSGLLVGASMTQKPSLFRAVLCIAPLLDMVRYEHLGHAAHWKQEYGSVDNAADFHALLDYSPYHHIEDFVDYPAVLFVSGDKDDRCNPAHVRKTAARLQERGVQTHSVLVDYSIERGHSAVLPLSVRVDALVRRIAFLCRELNISDRAGGSHEAFCS
jgi:prolyl oligopeptidase